MIPIVLSVVSQCAKKIDKWIRSWDESATIFLKITRNLIQNISRYDTKISRKVVYFSRNRDFWQKN